MTYRRYEVPVSKVKQETKIWNEIDDWANEHMWLGLLNKSPASCTCWLFWSFCLLLNTIKNSAGWLQQVQTCISLCQDQLKIFSYHKHIKQWIVLHYSAFFFNKNCHLPLKKNECRIYNWKPYSNFGQEKDYIVLGDPLILGTIVDSTNQN